MAFSDFPDIFSWIQSLPPLTHWKTNSISLCICSPSPSQPSLKLSIAKNNQTSKLYFSIVADFHLSISLWTSKPFKCSSKCTKLLDQEAIANLFVNFIEDVLRYGSNNNSSPNIKFPKLDSTANFKDIFNTAFFTLLFLICIYEAPGDIRSECLNILKNHLANCGSRRATKMLMKLLGSNLEEQWMRSINLAITNWIEELQSSSQGILKAPSPLFSYAISTFGLWKVQLYCPIIAMHVESSSGAINSGDDRLGFSLNYHQLQGVLQFNYRVTILQTWVEVMVNIDNIRYSLN